MHIRVQVISDDERVTRAARSLPDGYEVTISRNREQAFESIEKQGCDVAVLELEGGGFATAKDLRANEKTRHARIVMLCDRPHDRWLCYQAGADEVIVKPLFDVSTLTNAIVSVQKLAKTSE